MTLDETKQLLLLISGAYLRVQFNKVSPQIWFNCLKEFEFEVVTQAVEAHIKSSTFPPEISEIRKMVLQIVSPENELLTEWEAFALAKKAVGRFGTYQAKEGIASLPENVKAAVEAIGWREFCVSENPEALRAHFTRAYSSIKDRKEKRVVSGLTRVGNHTAPQLDINLGNLVKNIDDKR